ncbi:MAG: acetyl-CoA carboxylase carboxyltransferase subunit alpha [Chloroflexia bacterium]
MATQPKQNIDNMDIDAARRDVGSATAHRDMLPPGISRNNGAEGQYLARPRPEISAWERVQTARHPDRPHTLDYIQKLCPDFVEMHGDRLFGDDPAIVGGLGEFAGQTVMVIGQQKGRTTKENIARSFGMPQPEGYRKAQRLMLHAARFGFPILTFIDTPGANPGVQSEERGIGQAIAASLMTMLSIEVPVIATVIGEGGSGGALAIGIGDRVLMLENSIYSVASPEAAAAILWRDASQASTAAETMRITAPDLFEFGVIDAIIPEPEGGAHNDSARTLELVYDVLVHTLDEIKAAYPLHTKKGARLLLEDRRRKYRRMGLFSDPIS